MRSVRRHAPPLESLLAQICGSGTHHWWQGLHCYLGLFKAVRPEVRARYGLRGVRLGEASHPGPPKLVLRGVPRQNSSQVVDPTSLGALEEDLSDTQEDPQSAMSQVIELDQSDKETVVASEMGGRS